MDVITITHLMDLMCTSSSVNVSLVNVYLWNPSGFCVSICLRRRVFSCALIRERGRVWATFGPGVIFM